MFLAGLHNVLQGRAKGGAIRKKTRGYELVFSHRDSLALYTIMYHHNLCKLEYDTSHLSTGDIHTLYA